jgi:hypothetical protein
LRGPLSPLVHERLGNGGASGAWNAGPLAQAIAAHASGARDHGGALWTALQWELWWAGPSGPGGRPRGTP